MHLDVVELRRFYTSTALGRLARESIRERLRSLWPSVRGMTLVGFGYAAPFIRPFLAESARTLCLMPAQQGVCAWPGEGPNLAALVEETLWPLAGGSADRLVVAHALEACERPSALLDEVWRVLAPGGRAIFIVPNRAGMWARSDATPFGYGRPYSVSQLDETLGAHKFTATQRSAALYLMPSHRRSWLRARADDGAHRRAARCPPACRRRHRRGREAGLYHAAFRLARRRPGADPRAHRAGRPGSQAGRPVGPPLTRH